MVEAYVSKAHPSNSYKEDTPSNADDKLQDRTDAAKDIGDDDDWNDYSIPNNGSDAKESVTQWA